MSINHAPLQASGGIEFDRVFACLNNPIVFDIGANEGGYVETFLQKGAKEVFAFEPVPDMAKALRKRFHNDVRVIFSTKAVSDTNEQIITNVKPHLAWALLPHGNQPVGVALDYVDKPVFDIRTVTLDYFVGYGFDFKIVPNFLKIDVDGYEFKVLKGAERLLREYHPPILFEFSYLPTLFGDDVADMCRFIYDLGYEAVSMDGAYRCPSPEEMMAFYPMHTSYDIMLEARR